jgi:hypothetical protein
VKRTPWSGEGHGEDSRARVFRADVCLPPCLRSPGSSASSSRCTGTRGKRGGSIHHDDHIGRASPPALTRQPRDRRCPPSSPGQSGKDGPVAQYLVGAKLALRFPTEKIGNESYSTADVQLNRPGDFL